MATWTNNWWYATCYERFKKHNFHHREIHNNLKFLKIFEISWHFEIFCGDDFWNFKIFLLRNDILGELEWLKMKKTSRKWIKSKLKPISNSLNHVTWFMCQIAGIFATAKPSLPVYKVGLKLIYLTSFICLQSEHEIGFQFKNSIFEINSDQFHLKARFNISWWYLVTVLTQ